MLVEHWSEVEFDFRHTLHTSLRAVIDGDPDEVWRLLAVLLRRTDTHVSAAVAGWDRPWSLSDFLAASLYESWTGTKHPLLPPPPEKPASEADTRIADAALERKKAGGD